MDIDFLRFAIGALAGLAAGASVGWGLGEWLLNDGSVGIGLGVVIGAGVGAMIGLLKSP